MAPPALRIAHDLSLPLDAVTDTLGILAVKGAGKTYTFLVLVEELVTAGLPVVVLDPVGVCWGLRSSADGKAPGLPVTILGGAHADLPIDPGAGRALAEFVAAERRPLVVDTSAFETKADQIRFVLDFTTRLYQVNREPLHLVLDEADDMAPQKPFGEEARMLRAVEVLVRRGRARGLGVTLATQRAAVLNKNVLTQIGTLLIGRTVAPQDRKAIEGWVDAHGTPEQKEELLGSLASLPTGTVWAWSPDRGIFRRIQVRRRETFDSSATPKVGALRPEPRALAPVDLARLQERLAGVVEHARANDPRALRRELAEARRRLESLQRATPRPTVEKVIERVEVPVLDTHQVAQLKELTDALRATAMQVIDAADAITRALVAARPLGVPAPRVPAMAVAEPRPMARPSRRQPSSNGQPAASAPLPATSAESAKLGLAERKLLTALAQYPAGRTKTQAALLTGYAVGGGGFNNALGSLRSRGFIRGPREALQITDAGRAALGTWEPLPTGRALLGYWLDRLGKAERLILQVLADAHPGALTKQAVAVATGYEPTGGGFNNALGRLRTLELIEGRGELRASDTLFGAPSERR